MHIAQLIKNKVAHSIVPVKTKLKMLLTRCK